MVMFVAGSSAWAQDWQVVSQNALSDNSGFTIIDANGDGTTWQVDTYNKYIRYSYNYSNAANDFCVLNGEELVAGATYRVSFDVKRASYTEKFKIVCGTSASASQLTTVLLDTTIPTTSFATYSGTFTAPAAGTYYFAIQAVSDANQYYLYANNYKLEVDANTLPDDGSVNSTLNFDSWNLSYSGGSSKPASSTHFYNGEVFRNADGVTMTLTNIPNPQAWPSECFYSNPSGSTMALYLCNGEGFTIAAPTGYKLSRIQVNRAGSYSMTSLIINGVQNTNAASGTWTGEAESVAFSTISGDATKRILVSNIQVTLMPIVDEGEVTYTIDLVDAPAGAYVTLDGETFDRDNTYTVEKSLGKSDLEAYEPAGYYAEVEYTRDSHTYTVTYHAYNYYDVTVTGTTDPAAGVVYNEQTYGNGTRIETKDVLTQSSVEAADVTGYNVELTLTDGRFNVNYTEKPVQGVPWEVNVASIFNDCTVVDYNSDGKTWAKNGEEIYYHYHSSNYANDYIILPAVRLEAGKTYTVGVECHQDYTYTEKLEVLYGTTNSVAGMTNIAMPVKNVTWNDYAEVTNDFSVAADGVYYFAIHAVSNPDLLNLYVKTFSIKEPEPRQCVMDVASTFFSTGNVEQISSGLTFVADVNTEGEHSGYNGSSNEVPAGVILEDGNGTSYTISSMLWWDNSSQVAINLASAITAPGHYTLTIPEGVIPCVGNKANKEIVFEWTILEPTRYTVTVTGDYTGEDAGVRYNSNTYKDGDEIIVKGEIVESELTPVDVNGYDENVRIENQNIIVTYTTGANISYTVNVVNAPDGATVTLGNDEWTTNGEYTLNTPLTLDGNEIVASEPTGYYAVVNYENRVFTVTYYEYNYYSVVVKGTSDPAAGVRYDNRDYHAGDQIEARDVLTESSVTASEVAGYEGHVTMEGNTFTVLYTVPSYVDFVTSGISNISLGQFQMTKNNVTISGAVGTEVYSNTMLDIHRNNPFTVTSAGLPIEKVVFTNASSDPFGFSSDPAGFSGDTWTAGDANDVMTVSFRTSTPAEENLISNVRVYLHVPQLTTYKLAFDGEVPDGAKVTIEGQQYGEGEFDTYNENFTTTNIDATWPGYDAEVTYDEGTSTFTVTYYATTSYDVVVSPEGLEGAAVIYGENEYAAGTGVITCRGTIDEEALSAKGIYGYVGEVTVADNTITVTYTESDHFDIAESAISVVEGQYGMTNFKVNAPSGTSFSTLLQEYGNLITVNGEAKWTQLTLGYEGSFVTFSNPIGATEYGEFVVNFPADLFETADGKKNNAFSYTYTVEDPAAFTEPYFVNFFGYAFGQAAPADASANIVGFDDAISVSGQQYTAHPNVANFGDATTDLEGYDVTTSVNTEYKNVNVYFHKLALADSFSPANEENSLDDDAYQYGYSTLTVTFDAPLKEYTSITSTAITASLPDGVTISSIYGFAGSRELNISLSGGNVVGDYSITIPKGLLSFTYAEAVDQTITNAAVSKSWTLTPRTTFSFNNYGVTPNSGSEVANISGITIAAPADVEFTEETKNVTIEVNGVDTQVSATISADQIVLAYNATTPNTYNITIPAGIFTATDGRTNKALTGLTYTIQPTLSINANSVDDKGNYWTTFCLNKDFTLEDGYTPYIVRDNGNGGIKLVEVMGTEKVNQIDVFFTEIEGKSAAEHTANRITHADIDGKYEVTYEVSGRTGWSESSGFNYIDIYTSTYFYVTVLDPAYMPSKIGTWGWNCASKPSCSFESTGDNTFKVTVTSGQVGGLFFEIPTGEYNPAVIPAKTGILVKGTVPGPVTYTPASGGTKADVSGNLLWGCTKSELKTVEDYQYIYKLAWASEAYNDFGFYWGSNDGHSIQANSGKAYLILKDDQQRGSRMLIFGNQDEETTDINRFDTDNDNATIYTLQGKPISGEHLPAGIYIKNGRKFIVK